MATSTNDLTSVHKSNLHSIAISLLALLGRSTGVNNIMEYTKKVNQF